MLTNVKESLNKFGKEMQSESKNLFPIFLCLLLVISCSLFRNDTDAYFLYENGKKILEDGFPYYDWISMHDGLHLVMQQWIVSIIDYLVYSNFGIEGISILIVGVLFLEGLLIYKVSMLKSCNRIVAYMTTLFATFVLAFITSSARPIIYSIIIVTLTILVYSKYIKGSKNLIYVVPLLSILHSNMHSTFWIATMGTAIVYTFFIVISSKPTKNESIKLVLILIVSLIAGIFVNPYGYEAVFQAFYTIGYKEYNGIAELQPINGMLLLFTVLIPLIILGIRARYVKKCNKVFLLSDLALYAVTLLGTVFALRLIVFNIILWAFLMNDICMEQKAVEYKTQSKKGIAELSIACCLLIVGAFYLYGFNTTNFDRAIPVAEDYEQVREFLTEDGAQPGDTLFPTDVTEGQYFYHYLGMKPYMDGRLETYISSLNHNPDKDIFRERAKIESGDGFQDFVDKYKFNYLLVRKSHPLASLVPFINGYELVFDSSTDNTEDMKKYGYLVFKKVEDNGIE